MNGRWGISRDAKLIRSAIGQSALVADLLPAMDSESAQTAKPPGELYPPIEPYNSGFLSVSDIHKIYYEECGNKDGKPIVYL